MTKPTLLFLLASMTYAGQLASQAALVTALGGPGTTETFSHFSLASGAAANLDCSALNSTAVCNGQGPGLVVPGINITFGSQTGQWNGVNYFGSPAQEVAAKGQPLTVTFTTPVTAFGVYVRAYTGFAATATATILGPDDATVIGTIPNVTLNNTTGLVFIGWQASSGIGAVQFTQSGQGYSAPIENLEFGGTASPISTTPAPPAWLLIATGLAGLGLYRYNRVAVNAQTH
jgi:hypothetical protein